MNATDLAAFQRRLDLLEGYLRDDPHNPVLLADAFETALTAHSIDRAEFHLRHAQTLALDRLAWRLREAHWQIAQRRHDEASTLLHELQGAQGSPALQTAVAHGLASIAWTLGDVAAGVEALRGELEGAPEGAVPEATQALWLRLLHRDGRVAEAFEWAALRIERRTLAAEAVGVAALIALDAGDLPSARAWSEHALGAGALCVEALVARASVALAERAAPLARGLLEQALLRQPFDGRIWSAVGSCDLLEQRFAAARAAFDKAVAALPRHIGSWHGLAWSAWMGGDREEARRAFEAALALDRNVGESHGGLAVVQAMCGERDAAEQTVARALKLESACLSARYARAVLDGEAGDPHVVRRLAAQAVGWAAAPFASGTEASSSAAGDPARRTGRGTSNRHDAR